MTPQVQPSSSDPSGKDATLSATPDSSDALDITVRSLSHVRLIANTLKDLLFAACDGDADQVRVLSCTVLCFALLCIVQLCFAVDIRAVCDLEQ